MIIVVDNKSPGLPFVAIVKGVFSQMLHVTGIFTKVPNQGVPILLDRMIRSFIHSNMW